jgi:hypothetical protein
VGRAEVFGGNIPRCGRAALKALTTLKDDNVTRTMPVYRPAFGPPGARQVSNGRAFSGAY